VVYLTSGLSAETETPSHSAVAIDLDGTLLDSRSRLSSRSRAAICRCIAQGIPGVIATSRPVRDVPQLLDEELMGTCSLVTMNGAVAVGAPPLSGTFREVLPPLVARNLVKLVLELMPDVWVIVELDGQAYGVNM